MALQKTFKAQYANRLEYEAKNGIGAERYTQNIFPIDESQTIFLPTVEKPEGLLEKMDANDDFISAKALFEAYKSIPLVLASEKSFWAYLSHVDLYSYVRDRYPNVKEAGFNDANYINYHWFYGLGHRIYHPLEGLWWDVKMTYDEGADDPYKYTRFLFSDYNLRTSFLGRYSSFRNKEQVYGMLQFLMDDDEICKEHFRQRFRFISQHFNKVGATKQLISLGRSYFYDTLVAMRSQILAIETDEDVKNAW